MDHDIHPDVPFENFKFYMQVLHSDGENAAGKPHRSTSRTNNKRLGDFSWLR